MTGVTQIFNIISIIYYVFGIILLCIISNITRELSFMSSQ